MIKKQLITTLLIILCTLLLLLLLAYIGHYYHWNTNKNYVSESYNSYQKYQEQKKELSVLDMIRYYTSMNFSNQTRIIKYQYDTDKNQKSESLHVTVRIPNNELNRWIVKKSREYDVKQTYPSIIEKEKISNPYFYTVRCYTVMKGSEATQRTILFIASKSESTYTDVFISIGMLGWHLANSEKLGGIK